MEQKVSWFNRNVKRDRVPRTDYESAIIARIFFPTDKDLLDRNDKLVLSQVANYLRPILLKRERIELLYIGYADNRGTVAYNKKLAGRRANEVRRSMAMLLMNIENFSSVSSISMGEKRAYMGTKIEELLAEDRYVDIALSSVIHLGEFPWIESPPQKMRLRFRSFSKRNNENPLGDRGQGGNPFKEALGDITEGLLNKLNGLDMAPPGTENKGSQSWTHVDPTYRVNRVVIDMSYTYASGILSGLQESWYTSVTYTWGPPQHSVIVDFIKKKNSKPIINKSGVLTRQEADKSSFFFPGK